ncbi:hypothetical protein A5685_14770 [Mycobacterium colombiense]|uniref:DUF732 domain-containing protein n=1 Tax=Mycobacterium colombiense TaxID=339268 RepID=A0A1A2RMC6_9MYCO|nr:DUF732 domain-containing protein [Mycobacterium colombiense]OBH52697.1 hypothetical protein A5685_14770 [Mycobacterium colombiense]
MSVTSMRSWPAVVLAAVAPFLVALPPATAVAEGSDEFYLDILNGLPPYSQFGKQTLLDVGHQVCDEIYRGASEDKATDMVQSRLGISNNNAYRVVAAAELGYGCFSLKVHGM